MSYDPEFERFYKDNANINSWATLKDLAFSAWQAAKEPKQPEVKPLELEGGDYYINGITEVSNMSSTSDSRLVGRERKTKEQAELAAKHMLKRDRLAAWVAQHCGDEYEFKAGQDNCVIGYRNGIYEFGVHLYDEVELIGGIYMPRDTAIWLCDKLNSGEIVL